MRLPSPPRIVVVSREDKESKLKSFIAAALAARCASATESYGSAITLVARAPDSPVAQAICALAADIAAANIAVRVVLFETEGLSEDTVQSTLLDIAGIETRMLTDLRFAAAHEQLVVSHDQVWIGDCMRRDPLKRDAFEMYHNGHPATTAHAAASFAKLWDKATPLSRHIAARVSPDVILAGQQSADAAPASPRR